MKMKGAKVKLNLKKKSIYETKL